MMMMRRVLYFFFFCFLLLESLSDLKKKSEHLPSFISFNVPALVGGWNSTKENQVKVTIKD